MFWVARARRLIPAIPCDFRLFPAIPGYSRPAPAITGYLLCGPLVVSFVAAFVASFAVPFVAPFVASFAATFVAPLEDAKCHSRLFSAIPGYSLLFPAIPGSLRLSPVTSCVVRLLFPLLLHLMLHLLFHLVPHLLFHLFKSRPSCSRQFPQLVPAWSLCRPCFVTAWSLFGSSFSFCLACLVIIRLLVLAWVLVGSCLVCVCEVLTFDWVNHLESVFFTGPEMLHYTRNYYSRLIGHSGIRDLRSCLLA